MTIKEDDMNRSANLALALGASIRGCPLLMPSICLVAE